MAADRGGITDLQRKYRLRHETSGMVAASDICGAGGVANVARVGKGEGPKLEKPEVADVKEKAVDTRPAKDDENDGKPSEDSVNLRPKRQIMQKKMVSVHYFCQLLELHLKWNSRLKNIP